MNASLDLLIDTFHSENLTGSPQQLHFFKNKYSMETSFRESKIKDERDHSFIYYNKDVLHVLWKNKAGAIQFCGSAAYALAWVTSHHLKVPKIQIHSSHIQLFSLYKSKQTYLEFSTVMPERAKDFYNYKLYIDKSSGIFLLKFNSQKEIRNDQLIQRYLQLLEQDFHQEIHGLCVFFWDQKNLEGKLRYFTPWHGRDEDYVTGSIHRYLSPLIYELYKTTEQIWEQCSASGGLLKSSLKNKFVKISGKCSTNTELDSIGFKKVLENYF